MEIQKKPDARDIEQFQEYCVEHFGEVENDTVDKLYDRFCEDQQGEEIDYFSSMRGFLK